MRECKSASSVEGVEHPVRDVAEGEHTNCSDSELEYECCLEKRMLFLTQSLNEEFEEV